ncbi:MFS transporter, DHA2 family, multidrug resistance protein [Faunimonas pinastri]|uniref:MFS transporter, DHA2 family, multidrug resistance protein n=1 Tax=Faunimonas pinastri TaxID=1855383 RepID=A0A1H9NGM5_9HYPH|nr:MFS transporter [Faunimonas pinastri]SER35021.1 MFS transporter, DHA2 family, multidrug resistance protein [Faunimonas pinastri]
MQDGIPNPQRGLAFLTIGIALTMAVLDGAIVNVALPSIAKDLQINSSEVIWVLNAYQLAVTVSLLPLSSLGEILGYKRIYWSGLAIFTLASFLCANSTSLTFLILARVLQGFGAAGIMSVNIALVRFIFPQRLLGQGVGYTALVVGVSSAAGPSVAAAILSVAHWEWLFLVNVPLGILALIIAAKTLPRTPLSSHRFDWKSAILNALTFGLLIIGIDGLSHHQDLTIPLAELGAAILIGIVFVRRQLSLPAPMLPVDLLRRPIFALSMATSFCSFSAQMLAFVSLPFFFQDVLGKTDTQTGLLMTPWPLATAMMAPIAGRLADRFEPGKLGGIGLAFMAAGLAATALLPAHPSTLDIVWRLALTGFGFGLFQSPNNKAIISSAPRNRSGGASGLQSTGRLVGQSVGAALVAGIFGLFTHNQTQVALWLGVALALGGATASSFRRLTRDTAES